MEYEGVSKSFQLSR